MAILTFEPNIITENFISVLKDRTRNILSQYYGIDNLAQKKSLEAIGQQYGITRERVRQIKNFAIDSIKKSPTFEESQGVFLELKDIFDARGKILSEREISDYLAEKPKSKNHIFFLLLLGDDFLKSKEDNEFCHYWTIDKQRAEKVQEALRRLHQEIKEEDILLEKEIISSLKKHAKNIIEEKIRDEIIHSWLNISKIIVSNPLGEWGLASSPNIKPRGVRDLTFLVLRKQGLPMHFTEVFQKINQLFSKSVHLATVHNELIKDDRFVLVGRGIYALNEWGYKFGTKYHA